MTTDTDLHNALLDAVDADVDVAAFRAKLHFAIAAQRTGVETGECDPAPAENPLDAGEAFNLQQLTPPENSRSHHRWSAIALAACVAAISALGWFAVGSDSSTTPATHRFAPTPYGSASHLWGTKLFPGSVVISVAHGIGTQTVRLPAHHATLGPNQEYATLFYCSSGNAVLRGRQTKVSGKCENAVIGGSSLDRTTNSVHVEVRPDSKWKLAFLIEPTLRTNAGVESGSSVAGGNGPIHRGNGVVTLRQPDHGTRRSELSLTCSGSGFRLSGMNGAVKGDYTHTCFKGFAYVWDLQHVSFPATLHVHADRGTTWTVELR